MPSKLIPLQLLKSHPVPDTTVLGQFFFFFFFVAVCSLYQVVFHTLDIIHGLSPSGFALPVWLWLHFLMAL